MKAHSPPYAEEKFSVLSFAVTITLTLVPVFYILSFITPFAVWESQWNARWYQYLVIFLIAQFVNCFVEWAFHRYMLHAPVFPLCSKLYRSHHHIHHLKHTNVVPIRGKWKSDYPIEREEQHESSFFPWYSLLGFLSFAAPFACLFQWIFPTEPVLLMVIVSTVWSLVSYELIHAAWHWPAERWRYILSKYGKVAEIAYSFHLVHHAHLKTNEAISGWVFGLPLADWLLGTYKTCKVLFLNGAPVLQEDLVIPKPRNIVKLLDTFAELRIKHYQARRATR